MTRGIDFMIREGFGAIKDATDTEDNRPSRESITNWNIEVLKKNIDMDDVLAFYIGVFLLFFGLKTRKWGPINLLVSMTYGPILLGIMVIMIECLNYFFNKNGLMLFIVFPLSLIITSIIYLKDKNANNR